MINRQITNASKGERPMAEKVNVCRVGCGSTAEGGLHLLIGPIGLAITLCVKTRTETELGSEGSTEFFPNSGSGDCGLI